MTEAKYQPMPPLSDEEYAALKEDIRQNGQLVPILLDEDDEIIDGHHRLRICLELGRTPKIEVLRGLSEEQKWDRALALNNNRRHLSLAQRQEIVRNELTRDPSRSDRQIAGLLGVDHKTVARHRHLLFDPPDIVIPDPREFPRGIPTPEADDYPIEAIQERNGEWHAPDYEAYCLWHVERALAYYDTLEALGTRRHIVDIVTFTYWGKHLLDVFDVGAYPGVPMLRRRLERLGRAATHENDERLAEMPSDAERQADWDACMADFKEWNIWNWHLYYLQVLREGPDPEPEQTDNTEAA